MLGDLHVAASARFPARPLSQRLALFSRVVSLPATVAEEVLPRFGQSPSTPPAFVVVSVTEPLQLYSSGRMTGHQLVELSGQRIYACHRDSSFRPHRPIQSEVEVLAALVGLPLCLSC
jgi:hypothetical protein